MTTELFRVLVNGSIVATHTVEIIVPEDTEMPDAGEIVELSVDESETIPGVARSNGEWLPADCQQGWCTTCTARFDEDEDEVDQSAAHDLLSGSSKR